MPIPVGQAVKHEKIRLISLTSCNTRNNLQLFLYTAPKKEGIILPRPRKTLVSLDETPYYHVSSRCVRRAYLCGVDSQSGASYEHRRQWIVERIRFLSSVFAIDICSYAVMENHYHIVVKVCKQEVKNWDKDAILNRWLCLYKGNPIVRRYRKGEPLSEQEYKLLDETVEILRSRLSNLSWFMKCLNEPIARRANKEDQCTGHFWESRYSSHALKDETQLLSCMAYVDLNPVRADIAKTPESSPFTSIAERISPEFNISSAKKSVKKDGQSFDVPLKPLLSFSPAQTSQRDSLPISFLGYLELVDWTSRLQRSDKRGYVDGKAPAILARLDASICNWLESSLSFERNYYKRNREKTFVMAA